MKSLSSTGVISEAQKRVLKSQIDIGNSEVIHKLSIATDHGISTLAGDLLFHQNVISNIDGLSVYVTVKLLA